MSNKSHVLYLVGHQHQSQDMVFSGCPTNNTKDLYGNWEVGLDSAVNYADIAWNTFVGKMVLSHQGCKVSNEPQTTVGRSDMQ